MKKRVIISLLLVTVFGVVSAFAQERVSNKEKLADKIREIKAELIPSTENQCEAFGKYDFEGTAVSFEVVEAELQTILTLANPFGCRFVIDEKVKNIRVNMKVNAFSWNLALRSALESLDLEVEIEDSNFRVIKARDDYSSTFFIKPEPGSKTLFTEFVKLENLALIYESICFPNKKFGAAKSKEPDKLLNLLRKLLTTRGEILFDDRSHTIIVIDEKEKVKKITEFVKLLDESGFTLEEIVNNPDLEIK